MTILAGLATTPAQANGISTLARLSESIGRNPFEIKVPATPSLASVAQKLQITCMTVALYHEARGEPFEGQKAVAQVIMNRVNSRVYPNTACGVIYQNAHKRNRCQFSFACDTISDVPKNVRVLKRLGDVAQRALRFGFDVDALRENPHNPESYKRSQVTHYHTTAVSPSWGKKIEKIATIGAHIFYRSERVAKSL